MFSLFVIPFCLGVLALLVISVIKYFNWCRGFDRKQQTLIRKNILSWKFLPASHATTSYWVTCIGVSPSDGSC